LAEEKEARRIDVTKQERKPRCSACAAFPDLATAFLDSRSGRTIRLYQCECGERVWDD
jgi:hypothetical protein